MTGRTCPSPATGNFRPAPGTPGPVVIRLGLVRARDLERDGLIERELRPAVDGDERLAHEPEIGSHDRAGRLRPGLRVAVGPSRLGVFEGAGVEARRCFAFGAGPRADGKRLAGHRTSLGIE